MRPILPGSQSRREALKVLEPAASRGPSPRTEYTMVLVMRYRITRTIVRGGNQLESDSISMQDTDSCESATPVRPQLLGLTS